jgi:hypothetical protein
VRRSRVDAESLTTVLHCRRRVREQQPARSVDNTAAELNFPATDNILPSSLLLLHPFFTSSLLRTFKRGNLSSRFPSTTGVMAVIPNVPQVRVDIVVDGHQLPEYLDEDNSESTTSTSITKYVECKAGTRFAIRVNVASLGRRHLEGGNSAEVMYYVDGQQIDGLVLQRPWPSADDVFARYTTRYREGGIWKERDLMFTDLVTSMLFAGSSTQIVANTVSS